MYTVTILDMAHYQDPDHEKTITGFSTFDAAKAYAIEQVKGSLADCTSDTMTSEEKKQAWTMYGLDAIVIGEGQSYTISQEESLF